MITVRTSILFRVTLGLMLLASGLLAGCGGGDSAVQSVFKAPPQPIQSAFPILTDNYVTRYDVGDGDPPFPSAWQFADAQYPISVSYAWTVANPAGFDLVRDAERSFLGWAVADPRVSVISGLTPAASAHVQIILEDTVRYNNQTNIIGLTTVQTENVPSFKVEIARRYRGGGGVLEEMSADEIARTLMHELGHTLGLGHSPDRRDLMYYQANANQGSSFANFVTFGDALALWSTLNSRRINWISTRPTVTQFGGNAQPVTLSPIRAIVETRGKVLDVYTRE